MNASSHPCRRTMIVAILLLLLTVLATIAATIPARAAVGDLPYRIEPAMTSSTGLDQTGLRADASLLVWEDGRSGSPQIYGYDLDDQREFRVSAGDETQQQPAVSGSRIVWATGNDPAQRVIAGIDLSRGDTFSVTETPAEVSDPVISGVMVVWRQRVNDGWDLLAKNVQSGETFPITADPVDQAYPSISGDTVVWQEYRDGSWDIARYDLKTRQLSSLAGTKDDETNPVVDGTRVVYCVQPATGGPPRLVLDDLTGDEPRTIVEGHLIMSPDIADGVVVWEDWRTGLPDIYAYDIAGNETFAIARSQQAYAPAVSERGVSWISRTDLERGRVQAVAFVKRLPTDGQEPPAVPTGERLYIPETRHFISAGFKSYWQAHDGTELFGYPLTEEYTETDASTGEPVVVQYFERVKLEYRASAPEDGRITLARLGSELTQDRSFQPIGPFESTNDRLYIPETGHSLALGFKTFWESNGGAALFGYPISEEITENGRTVQYFERARFELNPDAEAAGPAVTLGLLGREALQRKGWLPAPPLDTTLLTE